jgi:cell division protease FtsH
VLRKYRILAIWTVLLLAAVGFWLARKPSVAPVRVPFSLIAQRLLHAPQLLSPDGLQILISDQGPAELRGRWKDGVEFVTTGLVTKELLEQLRTAKIGYEIVAPSGSGPWGRLLGALVLPVILVGLLLLFLRSAKGGTGQAMSYRKSRAKRLSESQRKTTFADVAGIEEARSEVEEIVAFLTDPTRFSRLGGRIPKGVLMMGPPGTGKTLLARAIAGEAGVPFFSISGSDFVEMFVGVGASRVRSMFEEGKANAPCIIFIDEIDAVGRRRGAGLGGGNDEREQTLNQLLVEMDGFAANEGVIIMAATNRPDVLDPALLRAGRFDRRMVIPAPDVGGRFGILTVHTRKTPMAADVDLRVIARGTTGFVGAELANLVNEAALLAARSERDQLNMDDFEKARDRVLMGAARRSMTIGAKERRLMACRQAGHALVGKMIAGMDPIHKVTIIPHGNALGITQQLPAEDRLNLSEDSANNQIAFLLAGRVAEQIVFGQISTGSAHDLEVATGLAGRMVREWGMSALIGPLQAERNGVEVDGEIRRLLMRNQERAREVIRANLDKLDVLSRALMDFETIDGAEVDVLLAGGKVTRPPLPGRGHGAPANDTASGTEHPGLLPLPAPVKA